MSAPASSPPSADRNLLFGILALQMDFITRDALVAAMNAWVLQKATPLGDVLRSQGAIQADTQALLDALVGKHLELHGGDAQKSLAAVRPPASVRGQLERIADPEVHATLGHVSTVPPDGDEYATRAPAAGDPIRPGVRFRVLRPHSRGGLGAVFVAHDEELHREVALKEIQGRHADDPGSRARFLLEAEVTGRLEHPGVVPVYGLGTHPDGRPYYAMRFIKGDSLDQAIARFHDGDQTGRDPGERTLALRQLLRRFVDVCNAVAYAHSRGILHRDLKPANVMLGPYGETLVVDWGLAKALGDRADPANGTAGEQPLLPTESDSALPTQMGSAVGTPAYMPPEQAAGQLNRLGPASDVYSLGATLYCLLTGKPPFEGADVGEVLRRVQRGESPPPRAVKPEVSAALEAVCRKAMALRPEDRYASPRELAGDVERWLADEPVGAWREPWGVRAGRWARRHQTLVAVGATALVLVVLAAIAAAWRLDRERAELRHGVESDLEDVADFQAHGRWEEARAVLAEARHRLGAGGPRDLRDKLERAQADLDLVARLFEIRLRRASLVNGYLDTAGTDRHFEEAFREAGMAEVGSDPTAAAAWVRASDVHDALLASLDVWAACARDKQRHDWLVDVARRVADDPWRDRLQAPQTWNDPAALARMAATDEAARQSPHLLCVLGMRLRELKGDGEPVLRLARRRYPSDFWVNFNLATVLRYKGKPAEAIGYHLAALSLSPETSVVHNDLGVALADQKRYDEALVEYRKALELDPRNTLAHNNLGMALAGKGRTEEAIAAYRKALELDPHYVHAHNNLGNALNRKGRRDEAAAEYRKAIDLNPRYSSAHANLGSVLNAKGQQKEAAAEYARAVELGREAVRRNPESFWAHKELAYALKAQGNTEEAIAEYRKVLELAPADVFAQYDLGWTLAKQGRQDEALGEYYKASALCPWDADLYLKVGYLLAHKGRRSEAVAEYRKAIEIDPHYALAHNNLGATLREMGQLDEALAECRKAMELDPKLAVAPYGIGLCLSARGEPVPAIDAYRKALELNPRNAHFHDNLGLALADRDDLDAAIAALRQGMECDPKLASIHRNLALVLKRRGDLEEALTQFQRALELDPKSAWTREQLTRCQRLLALDKKREAILKGDVRLTNPSEKLDVAELCLLRQRPAAAVRYYTAAFTERPQLAEDSKAYRYDAVVAAARAAAGRGEDAKDLGEEERHTYHRQAIRWLRDHLVMRARQIEHGKPGEKMLAQKQLRLWLCRADFAVLRGTAALEELPEADRAACRKLWDDVAALLKK